MNKIDIINNAIKHEFGSKKINRKKLKIKQLTNKYQFVCGMSDAAKYVRLQDNHQVQIQVLYRYGKPSIYNESINKFINKDSHFNWTIKESAWINL